MGSKPVYRMRAWRGISIVRFRPAFDCILFATRFSASLEIECRTASEGILSAPMQANSKNWQPGTRSPCAPRGLVQRTGVNPILFR